MRGYRAKMVESTRLPDRAERETALREAGHNVFNIPSDVVYVDLLTDSGTGTMSAEQWASLLLGDEAYAGASSFDHLQEAVEETMGFSRIVPAHQGRGAENVLYGSLVSDGDVVLNNAHFDTTRAHITANGGDPVDCPTPEAADFDSESSFKGNFDVDAARDIVDDIGADRVPAIIVTITNNSTAGQPVSIANLRETRAFADEIDATFAIDACRFAENAYFVQQREPEFEGESVAAIAREELSDADAIVMSGKKDGLTNIGGFVAVRDDPDLDALYDACRQRGILYEGFTTYGGMAGRDLEAFAVGLREAVTDHYVTARVGQVRELGERLDDADVPIYWPPGGHAVYLDANALLPHIESDDFPGQALACALYEDGGVRGVELGSFAFPDTDRPDLVRLAIPRRTYSIEDIQHVVDTAETVADRADELSGYRVVSEPSIPELRHFSAELEPLV